MSAAEPLPTSARHQSDRFATTRWSLVRAAGESESPEAGAALHELCSAYWMPVYLYVRHRVADVHEAQDLTQAFFTRLLEREVIAAADPDRGRFRSYLLTNCRRFLINEWDKLRAQKRGGNRQVLSLDFDSGESRFAIESVDQQTPEKIFERQWAITLLERVLDRLEQELAGKGKQSQFDELKLFLTGQRESERYSHAARKLGMSESAIKVTVHRLRARYRELLWAEIAETVSGPEHVEDEIRRLFLALGSDCGSNRL